MHVSLLLCFRFILLVCFPAVVRLIVSLRPCLFALFLVCFPVCASYCWSVSPLKRYCWSVSLHARIIVLSAFLHVHHISSLFPCLCAALSVSILFNSIILHLTPQSGSFTNLFTWSNILYYDYSILIWNPANSLRDDDCSEANGWHCKLIIKKTNIPAHLPCEIPEYRRLCYIYILLHRW